MSPEGVECSFDDGLTPWHAQEWPILEENLRPLKKIEHNVERLHENEESKARPALEIY